MDNKTQVDKFREAARDLACEVDEARFDEHVKKLVKVKPADGLGSEPQS